MTKEIHIEENLVKQLTDELKYTKAETALMNDLVLELKKTSPRA